MTWFRDREAESYKYSRRAYVYGPDDDGCCPRRRRPSWHCDEPIFPSYTTNYCTYIYPVNETVRCCGPKEPANGSKEPAKCECKCCPHESTPGKESQEVKPEKKEEAQPKSSEGDASKCPCGCPVLRSLCQPLKPASGSGDDETAGRSVIQVVDRTGGPLCQVHGPRFPVSIAPQATTEDIILLLAPDRKRHKVVVRWRDGEMEDLDDMIRVDEIRRHAGRLYIKDRKCVRWC